MSANNAFERQGSGPSRALQSEDQGPRRARPGAQRGRYCGSTLFWKPNIEGYEYTAVAMGALEAPTGPNLSKHTFVGDKEDYYEILDGVPQSESY
jgi:hypothetical protein